MTQFLANAAFYATQFLIPLYLITGCALSPSKAGWLVAAMGGGMMCSFPFVGTLTDRFGCRAVSAGGAVAAVCGMLPFLWMSHSAFSAGAAVACLFATGIGQGTITIPSVSAAYASVPKERIPVANSAINIVQRLGGPLATTLMAVIIRGPQARFRFRPRIRFCRRSPYSSGSTLSSLAPQAGCRSASTLRRLRHDMAHLRVLFLWRDISR